MKSPKPFIGAAYDSLKIITERVGDDRDQFLSNSILQDATLMRIMDAGEQLARVRDAFPGFYDSNASRSWDRLIGLRNIIAHGYLVVNFEIIWNIIRDDLPELIAELEKLS